MSEHQKPTAAYSCPVCGGNKNRYLTCEYPGCPDGHDQGGIYYPSEPRPKRAAYAPIWILIAAMVLYVAALIAAGGIRRYL